MNIENLALGYVKTAPSPATTGTSLTLETNEGARFPTTTTESFYVTLMPANENPNSDNSEVVEVTDRTGDVLTIVREQRGTTAQNVGVGWIVLNSVYKEDLENLNAETLDGQHAPIGDIVGTTDTQTLTNKTIDGDDNTITLGTARNVYVTTVYYTSDGTFVKGDYSYLKAIKVKVQGAGGGGGGVDKTVNQAGCGGAGGGGGYSEKFILASALGTSETVTVGEGGAGGALGNNNGTAGETSSFGTHCTASGGGGGSGEASSATVTRPGAVCGNGGVGSDGDLNINGDAGIRGLKLAVNSVSSGQGGGCFMSGLQAAQGVGNLNANGSAGKLYGGGGNGGLSGGSSGNDAAGGDGADGIVIVELYA